MFDKVKNYRFVFIYGKYLYLSQVNKVLHIEIYISPGLYSVIVDSKSFFASLNCIWLGYAIQCNILHISRSESPFHKFYGLYEEIQSI